MKIPILVYHKVGIPPENERAADTYVAPADFSRQMRLLSFLGYKTITLRSYSGLLRGELSPGVGKPLVIAFDDASVSVVENALPVMTKYGFTGCLFAVASLLGGKCAWDAEGADSPHRLMTARELAEIRTHGWEICSHSLTHQDLTAIPRDAAVRELKSSKEELERLLGESVLFFAYPYGKFNSSLKESAEQAGYELAFATEQGDGSRMAVPRRIISGRRGLVNFLARLVQAKKLSARLFRNHEKR